MTTTQEPPAPADDPDGGPAGTVPAVVDGHRLPVVDASARQDVEFRSAGLRLAGHLYRPPGTGPGQRTPALVMAGPMTSVKE